MDAVINGEDGRLLVMAPVESLSLTGHNLIDGQIWLETGDGRAFPGEGWFDFAAQILGDWLTDFVSFRALAAPGMSREVMFWDGPQRVRIVVLDREQWAITFFPRGTRYPPAGAPYAFAPDPFLESLRRAAWTTLQWSEERGWESTDLGGLQAYRWLLTGGSMK